jgi:hypothetical protein
MNVQKTTQTPVERASSLAHALLESLHHLLVCRHPWSARAIFLLVRWREPERFTLGIADNICVGLGAQGGTVDYKI